MSIFKEINMGKGAAFLIALPLFFATSVKAGMGDFCLPSVYIGVDAQIRNMKLKRNYGGNLFHSDYPQANVFLGIKANDFIGVEAGYEVTHIKKHTTVLPTGAPLFGIPFTSDLTIDVKPRIRTFYTSLIGFFPVFDCDNLKLIASIGVANIRLKLNNQLLAINNVPFRRNLTLAQSKNILRLMGGIQYVFADFLGIRATVRWEKTAQLSKLEPLGTPSPNIAKAQDSYVYGIGLFLQF